MHDHVKRESMRRETWRNATGGGKMGDKDLYIKVMNKMLHKVLRNERRKTRA
jgi:hypothetical protein